MGSPSERGRTHRSAPTQDKSQFSLIALALRLLAVFAGKLIEETFAIEIGEDDLVDKVRGVLATKLRHGRGEIFDLGLNDFFHRIRLERQSVNNVVFVQVSSRRGSFSRMCLRKLASATFLLALPSQIASQYAIMKPRARWRWFLRKSRLAERSLALV